MKPDFFTNDSFVWQTIEEYAPKLGITCPIDLRVKKLKSYLGMCALRLPTPYKYRGEKLPRPFVYLVLDHDLVCGKYGMDKLRDVIIHELIHGTGIHCHNKHFYETAMSLGIELEHGSYEKFAACHR